ncbi:MAG: chlorite dismutase family protein [Elusimicrobia bacterium]|nr:chlorite dismutase family protein [Elusimicrobiota bacterium]
MENTLKSPQASTVTGTNISRQYVNFLFLKLDPQFRRLPTPKRAAAKKEFLKALQPYRNRMILLSYSLSGLRADCDLMLWRISTELKNFQEMSSQMLSAGLGQYLLPAYSYLAMTRRSIYMDKLNPEHDEDRTHIVPGKYKYLFVYPFVKNRAWYQLPKETRQQMMDEHIRIGSQYPRVKLNTTYSYGLDDQEFVVAFETDYPQDFLDLVMELRESKASEYTLRDTPTFTCASKGLEDILEEL